MDSRHFGSWNIYCSFLPTLKCHCPLLPQLLPDTLNSSRSLFFLAPKSSICNCLCFPHGIMLLDHDTPKETPNICRPEYRVLLALIFKPPAVCTTSDAKFCDYILERTGWIVTMWNEPNNNNSSCISEYLIGFIHILVTQHKSCFINDIFFLCCTCALGLRINHLLMIKDVS